MDSILSSVLSIFSHNPIFVLGIIAYIAFSIIKSKNTEESDDYDNYESSSSGQTWEDMAICHRLETQAFIEFLDFAMCRGKMLYCGKVTTARTTDTV